MSATPRTDAVAVKIASRGWNMFGRMWQWASVLEIELSEALAERDAARADLAQIRLLHRERVISE